jgi:ribosomal protein S2
MRLLNKLYLLNKGVFIGDKYYNYKTKSIISKKLYSNFIFDFNQSLFFLKKSLKLVSDLVKNRGTIVLYSSKLHNSKLALPTSNFYIKSNIIFITDFWITGSLSNYKTNNKLLVKKIPNLIISISSSNLENSNILHEASSLAIPVIVLVSSNFQFDLITYPIWGNNSKLAVINTYVILFYNAILNGLYKEKKLKIFKKK